MMEMDAWRSCWPKETVRVCITSDDHRQSFEASIHHMGYRGGESVAGGESERGGTGMGAADEDWERHQR